MSERPCSRSGQFDAGSTGVTLLRELPIEFQTQMSVPGIAAASAGIIEAHFAYNSRIIDFRPGSSREAKLR